MTTYALAVRLAKRPATAYLAPYVADMRRALGRGTRRQEVAGGAAGGGREAAGVMT